MKKIFHYIRLNHVQIMILGIVIIIMGLFVGIGMNEHLIIKKILLGIGFSIGISIFLYGSYSKVYENKKTLLKKCVVFTLILFLVIYITPIISKESPKYYNAILVGTISLGIVLMEGAKK